LQFCFAGEKAHFRVEQRHWLWPLEYEVEDCVKPRISHPAETCQQGQALNDAQVWICRDLFGLLASIPKQKHLNNHVIALSLTPNLLYHAFSEPLSSA
jgi:hypothetical protein